MRFLRQLILTVLVLAVLAGFAVAGGAWFVHASMSGPGPLPQAATVEIPRGTRIRAIAEALYDRKIIANPYIFLAAAEWRGVVHDMKAGEYAFPGHVPLDRVLAMMAKGEVVQHRLTVPEGFTSWQVVQAIEAEPALSGPVASIPPDGSLLPETYVFLRGDSRQSLIDRMQAGMTRTLARLWAARAPNALVATPAQAVTLASIVEKESGVAAERPRIAGVFLNRLARGMKLQSDPTAIYALTQGRIRTGGEGPLGRRLTLADLRIASPYNTYQVIGLPPGPIANPGAGSIEAVLHPEANAFLYFVANGTGGHAFAATLPEQDRNVAQWREIRKGEPAHP